MVTSVMLAIPGSVRSCKRERSQLGEEKETNRHAAHLDEVELVGRDETESFCLYAL